MLTLPQTDSSFWRESYDSPSCPQLDSDISVDVLVIGTGIAGLTAAYLLASAGKTVAVLEKRTIGSGTTGRTTGKVTSQHNLIYSQMVQGLGSANAQRYAEANQAGVELIHKIVTTEEIECGWEPADNYVYTTDPNKLEAFKQEANAASSLGLPAKFTPATPLPFATTAAVTFSNQAHLNAQKYLLGLASCIQRYGGYIFENSAVIHIWGGTSCRASTTKASVRAKQIIVATNVPTLPLIARGTYCFFEYPVESYIVAGITKTKLDGMYISPDSNNYSVLPFRDGGVQHILVGGEGHFSALRYNRNKKFQKLANFAEQHFGVYEITNKWSDRDYIPYDGIPLVGPLYPWSKNIYAVSGLKKWGLSNGTAAAMILRDLVLGQSNAWAPLYYPHQWRRPAAFPHAVTDTVRSIFHA